MKVFKLLGAAGLVMLAVAGCKKSEPMEDPQPVAAISFYNASPDAPALAIYLNANRLSADSLKYKSGYDYVYAYTGSREVSANRGNEKKFAKTIQLDQGRIYSAFLTGNYATAEFVLLQDSLVQPAAGKAHIRFVNMSVGAPSLDLGVSGVATPVVNGRTYKANSGFIAIDANKQYNFVVRDHGSTTDKVILPSVSIVAGGSYTIWARGIYTATDGAALGAEITRNY